MNRRTVIGVGLLLFIVLAIICLMSHPQKIESKLAGLSKDALKSAGIGGMKVNFNGRDGTLNGVVDSEDQSKQAVDILKRINGVRSVSNLVNIVTSDVKAGIHSNMSRNDSLVHIQEGLSDGLFDIHIHFATNSSHPASHSRDVLARTSMLFKKHVHSKIEIAGHTDSRGTQAYNHKLSLRRAQSVKALLIKAGVKADRFLINGYGEKSPIANNTTPEGMAKNRRVEFRIIKED